MRNLIQSLLLFIAVLMSALGADEVIYAQVGETVQIKCPDLLSHKYVYWQFDQLQLAWVNHLNGRKIEDNKNWTSKLSFSTDSLIITNIQQENFGTFCCKMTVDGHKIKLIYIKVLKLEVSMETPIPLLPEESLSLSCSVDVKNNEKPEIFWLNPRRENVSSSQGTVLKKATVQDNGDWICVVKDEKKVKEAKISVSVVGFAQGPLRPQYTSNSMRLNIPCAIAPHISWEQVKARDVQEVYWQFLPKPSSGSASYPTKLYLLSLENPLKWSSEKHRDLKTAQNLKSGNLSLTRKQSREEDRGDYTCVMKFKNGLILNRTVHVEWLKIIASPQTNIVSGQPLNLTCTTDNPLPSDLKLQWSLPQQSSLKPDRHSEHLIIPEVGTGDGGTWSCELWQGNTILASAVITLKIEHKLSLWMLAIICSAAAIVVLIPSVIFILCWHRQRKMRHLRHRLRHCQCNLKPKGFYRT